MKNGNIVFIKSLGLEGILLSHAIDVKTNKMFCVIYCEGDSHYIVEESDLVFVETLEESLETSLTVKPLERISAWYGI